MANERDGRHDSAKQGTDRRRRGSQISRRATLGLFTGAALLSACAPGPAGQSPPATGAPQTIAEGRRKIDELDGRIIDLIRQRVQVSRGVQQARTSAGGQQTDPRREEAIVARYQSALGPSGAEVAHAVLDASRGRQPVAGGHR
jgi:chorismate mutase